MFIQVFPCDGSYKLNGYVLGEWKKEAVMDEG